MSGPYPDRRELLGFSAAALVAGQTPGANTPGSPRQPVIKKRYPFKKSINQWAFPYPEKMNLEQCLRLAKDAGFDGIELNYDLDNDLSPKSSTARYTEIRKLC